MHHELRCLQLQKAEGGNGLACSVCKQAQTGNGLYGKITLKIPEAVRATLRVMGLPKIVGSVTI
jgi:hypothetical protein